MLIPRLTILLTIAVFAHASPTAKLEEPCISKEADVMTCENKDRTQHNLEQLVRYLKHENRTTFKRLKLRNVELGTLKLQALNEITFRSLLVSNCQLSGIVDEGVADVQLLRDIDIVVSVDTRKVDFQFNLQKLQNVNSIRFFSNQIKSIPKDWFGRSFSSSLRFLSLSGNNIEYIADGAFNHLMNVRSLILSKNQLQVLKRTTMPPVGAHLEHLDLSVNRLTALPPDLFSGFPLLKRINLQKNILHHLPEDTWKSIWPRLTVLNLNGNRLDCSSSIEWIAKVSEPLSLSGKCLMPSERSHMKLVNLIKLLRQKGNLPSHPRMETAGNPQPIAWWWLLPLVPLLNRT